MPDAREDFEHRPERIVAVTDENGTLVEYQALAPGDTPKAGEVEYVRADAACRGGRRGPCGATGGSRDA